MSDIENLINTLSDAAADRTRAGDGETYLEQHEIYERAFDRVLDYVAIKDTIIASLKLTLRLTDLKYAELWSTLISTEERVKKLESKPEQERDLYTSRPLRCIDCYSGVHCTADATHRIRDGGYLSVKDMVFCAEHAIEWKNREGNKQPLVVKLDPPPQPAERITQLKADVKRWKANHDSVVAKKRRVSAMLAGALHRISSLESMLSKIEWYRSGWRFCPICDRPEMLGHDDNCELDALLHLNKPDTGETQ